MANWWEPTTGSYTCVAAYQAIGAADLATSYVNLANPGTNDAAPGDAPTFDASTGWTFNGSSDYLTTGLTPGSGWTMLVRYSNRPGGTLTVAGATAAANAAPYFAFVNFGNTPTRQWYMAYGSAGSTAYSNDAAAAVLGLAGLNRYFDGVSIGALTGSWTGTPQEFLIGGQYNTAPTVYRFWGGKIQAVAIYSTTLDATQMAEISANMAALPVVELVIEPEGMAVGAAFGTAVVGRGTVAILPEGTAVGSAFGTAVISVGEVDIAPDGTAVGVAFGTAVVSLAGVPQAIEPDGLAVAMTLGDITVTRRAAVDVPLYVIDYDERVWTVPAESRLYYVEA